MINALFLKFKYSIKLSLFRALWRKKNIHNRTTASNVFPTDKVSVGKMTYGSLYIKTYGNPNERLDIGSYCSIAGDVKFLLGGEHSYRGFSTYPFRKYVLGSKENTLTKGPITIKDDVWIGEGSMILSGTTIGQGAIVAAGSVVAKDIPPYAIFAGGKIIKYRFSKEIIECMLKVDFNNLDEEYIKNNINLLYSDVNNEMLNDEFFANLIQ